MIEPGSSGVLALPPTLFLDSNLFILYVVGLTDRRRIPSSRVTREYTEEDFDLLLAALARFHEIRVTPNVATETGNRLDWLQEPFRSQALGVLARILRRCQERYVPSEAAVGRAEYRRIGLADSATIEAARDRCLVLTADLELYRSLLGANIPAQNFNHLRAV